MNKNNNITNVLIDTFYLTADEFIKTKNDAYLFSATEFLFQIMENIGEISFEKTIEIYNKAFSLICEEKYKNDLEIASSYMIKEFYADKGKLKDVNEVMKESASKYEKELYSELADTYVYRKQRLLTIVWQVVARELIFRQMLRCISN
ncbi:MAG: hypothetical protein IJN43_11840 [Ruminococcus sp.]|nr:hypothetical protein [Ruminococcus sp.]